MWLSRSPVKRVCTFSLIFVRQVEILTAYRASSNWSVAQPSVSAVAEILILHAEEHWINVLVLQICGHFDVGCASSRKIRHRLLDHYLQIISGLQMIGQMLPPFSLKWSAPGFGVNVSLFKVSTRFWELEMYSTSRIKPACKLCAFASSDLDSGPDSCLALLDRI